LTLKKQSGLNVTNFENLIGSLNEAGYIIQKKANVYKLIVKY